MDEHELVDGVGTVFRLLQKPPLFDRIDHLHVAKANVWFKPVLKDLCEVNSGTLTARPHSVTANEKTSVLELQFPPKKTSEGSKGGRLTITSGPVHRIGILEVAVGR